VPRLHCTAPHLEGRLLVRGGECGTQSILVLSISRLRHEIYNTLDLSAYGVLLDINNRDALERTMPSRYFVRDQDQRLTSSYREKEHTDIVAASMVRDPLAIFCTTLV
jgi:hypothetical protein